MITVVLVALTIFVTFHAVRPPDLIIGPLEHPYMRRWHIVPRNKWFNVYLHNILRSDDDHALHDHPWWSVSFLLKGPLWEFYRATPAALTDLRKLPWLWPVTRPASYSHRLALDPGETAWTIFITGRRVREWGFWCPQGWKHWKAYVAPGRKGIIGRGCDDE